MKKNMNESDENVKLPDSKSKYSSDLSLKDKLATTVIGLLVALALTVFTVLVLHVRITESFGIETREERIMTFMQLVVWFLTFVGAWKILNLVDRDAAERDKAAGKTGAGDKAAGETDTGDKAAGESDAGETDAGDKAAGETDTGESNTGESDGKPGAKYRRRLLFCWNVRGVIVTALLLLCLFYPYMYAYYPGVSSLDTTNQIKDYVTDTMPIEINWRPDEPLVSCFLNDHHPVTDTLIFVYFTEILGGVIGPQQGAYVYTCIQAFLTALFMSLLLCRMEKWGVPFLYRLIGFLYLGLSPFIPLYVIGMLKDSLHCMFYIPYFLVYLAIIKEGATHPRMILLVLLSLALSLTKKTGLYLILICDIALILIPSVRKKIAGWAVSWMLPALLMIVIMPNFIFPAYNIFPGGNQEKLGFTLQMSVRTYMDHKDQISAQDVRAIRDVLDLDTAVEDFYYMNYDDVKHLFNFDATDQQISTYLKTWLRLFIRFPRSGIKALFGTAGGFFTPTERIRIYNKFQKNKYTDVENLEEREPLRQIVADYCDWLNNLHGIGMLLQCVLYMWWLPLFALMRILLKPEFRGKRFEHLMCMVPTAVSIAFLWISPYSMARYGLPILYTLPMIMGIAATKVPRN